MEDKRWVPFKREWISIEDLLPSEGRVLFCSEDNYIFSGRFVWYDEGNNYSLLDDDCIRQENITHWMPSPEPPKE